MRVVLAEDLYLLRSGLERLLLAHGFDVVASVDNAPELLRALTGATPDVDDRDIRLLIKQRAQQGRAVVDGFRYVEAMLLDQAGQAFPQ